MAEEEEISEELLPNEIKAIETEIRTALRKEQRQKKRDELKAKLRTQIRQEKGIDEPLEEVVIDLAKHADRITIDNCSYLQGIKYTVKASLARELRWIMQSTHEHQSEIDGKPKRYYNQRHAPVQITPHGVVTTTGVLRA